MSARGSISAAAIACAGWCLSPVGFKGYWRFTRLAGRMAGANDRRIIPIGDRGRFKVSLRDPYWSRLISPAYVYEPEISWALHHLRRVGDKLAFLDCGANFGYWSIFAQEMFPGADVIAVEASPGNYAKLVENLTLNGSAATDLNAAIYDRSGETVMIASRDGNHAGSHIGTTGTAVGTTTIDDIVAQYSPKAKTIIVKLDVEGVECQAMAGAANTIANRDVAFLYEDHGNDPASSNTDYVINQLGFRAFFIRTHGGFLPVASAAEASALKIDAKYGYNFMALSPASAMLPS